MDHFSIILKLSVIMGVPWILEVVSAALDYQYGSVVFELSVILDILNLLIVSWQNIEHKFDLILLHSSGNSDISLTDLQTFCLDSDQEQLLKKDR